MYECKFVPFATLAFLTAKKTMNKRGKQRMELPISVKHEGNTQL